MVAYAIILALAWEGNGMRRAVVQRQKDPGNGWLGSLAE